MSAAIKAMTGLMQRWQRGLVGALACGLLLGMAAAAPPPALPQLPNFDGWHKTASTVAAKPDWGLPPAAATAMQELGLNSLERATYRRDGRTLQIAGYHFADAGGAYGALTYERPAQARDTTLGREPAAAAGADLLFLRGDWLISVQPGPGAAASTAALRQLARNLAASAGTDPLPALAMALPRQHLVPGSLHFVRGPAGFAAVCSWVPPAALGFNKSAEAMIGSYDFGGGVGGGAQMVLISYPTPQIARSILGQLQRLPGFQVRRSGPLVVLVHGAAGTQAAALLQSVRWDADITVVPALPPTTLGELPALILGIFVLCALIMGVAVVVGLLSGVLWVWADRLLPRRFRRQRRPSFICLDLHLSPGEKFTPGPHAAR